MWENVPSDIYAQRRLKLACSSAQSHQYSVSSWRNFASLAIQIAPSEDSEQTARMRSLIRIFTVRSCQKVHFLTFRFQTQKFCKCHYAVFALSGRYSFSFQGRSHIQGPYSREFNVTCMAPTNWLRMKWGRSKTAVSNWDYNVQCDLYIVLSRITWFDFRNVNNYCQIMTLAGAQNLLPDCMCAQQRFRSTCAYAQSN